MDTTTRGHRIVLAMMALGLMAIFVSSFYYRLNHPLKQAAAGKARAGAPGTMDKNMADIQKIMEHLQHTPDDAGAITAAAEAFMSMRAWDKAEPFWRRLLAIEPDNLGARFHVGVCLTQTRKYPEAVAEFEAMLAVEPDNYPAHYYLGMIHKNFLNDAGRARMHLRKILDANPADQPLLEQVRQELQELG